LLKLAEFNFCAAAEAIASELCRRKLKLPMRTLLKKAAALLRLPICSALLARRNAVSIIRGITVMIGKRQAPNKSALFESSEKKSEDVS
jgi:hypothetical protein